MNKQYLLWITVKHALLCCTARQSKSLQLQCVLMFTTISGTEPENHSQINNSSSLLLDIHLQPVKHALISISFFLSYPKYLKYLECLWRRTGIESKKEQTFYYVPQGIYTQIIHLQTTAKPMPNSAPVLQKYKLVAEWLFWGFLVQFWPHSSPLGHPLQEESERSNFHDRSVRILCSTYL